MVKTFEVDGIQYKGSYKGITARIYREQFHSDLLIDINDLEVKVNQAIREKIENQEAITETSLVMLIVENAGEEKLTRLLWAAIQGEQLLSGRSGIDYQSFIDNVEDYPELIGQSVAVYNMMTISAKPTTIPEKEDNSKKKVK